MHRISLSHLFQFSCEPPRICRLSSQSWTSTFYRLRKLRSFFRLPSLLSFPSVPGLRSNPKLRSFPRLRIFSSLRSFLRLRFSLDFGLFLVFDLSIDVDLSLDCNLFIDFGLSLDFDLPKCFDETGPGFLLISAFDFATFIVQFLYLLNPKFQTSIHPLWLYSLVFVVPGRTHKRQGFS